MRYYYLFAIIVLVVINGFTQILPSGNFRDLVETQCINDSTQNANTAMGWDIYSTTNNHYDGPIDSSYCFNITTPNAFIAHLDLTGFPSEKPIFIRSQIYHDSLEVLLNNNSLYSIDSYFSMQSGLESNLNCGADSLCAGVIIVSEIPDATGSAIKTRVEEFPYTEYYGGSVCYVTDKMEYHRLREFIIKLSFSNISEEEAELRMFSVGFSIPWFAEDLFLIDSLKYDQDQVLAGDNELSIYDISDFYPAIFVHPGDSYPDWDNIGYVEATVVPNIDEAQDLILDMEESALNIQPYTMLRGGLIKDSDSIRHSLTIEVSESFACFGNIVDLINAGNTHWLHKGGGVNFTGHRGCLAFIEGATFTVDYDADVSVGSSGLGVFMFDNSADLILRQGSNLYMDSKFVLKKRIDLKDAPKHMRVQLHPSTSLTFSENAKVKRDIGAEEQFLEIEMLGGTLDLSKLDSESRRLIRLIYPEDRHQIDKAEFIIRPNPARENVEIVTDRFIKEIEIYDLYGRSIQKRNSDYSNQVSLNVAELSPGLYIVKILDELGRTNTKQFIKI